jgi:phosphopantothenate---cysteine ligase (ATP)
LARGQLETDGDLLVPKARAAIERYGHQLVIGNDLSRRKQEVVFVTRQGEEWLRVTPAGSSVSASAGPVEIEVEIVDRLVRKHTDWIEGGETSS